MSSFHKCKHGKDSGEVCNECLDESFERIALKARDRRQDYAKKKQEQRSDKQADQETRLPYNE